MKLVIIGILVATLTIASTTSAALASRNPWEWWDGDELDLPLPPRFTLNITTPGGEFSGYRFTVYWENNDPFFNNLRLAPPGLYVDPKFVPTFFVGENYRFYFEPQGAGGRHLYMDIFAQASSPARFRSFDAIHYHAGYTFDGFSTWHGLLVRRYEMNDRYQLPPRNQWLVCAEYDSGELDLVWDAFNDPDAPPFVKESSPYHGCDKVDVAVTAI